MKLMALTVEVARMRRMLAGTAGTVALAVFASGAAAGAAPPGPATPPRLYATNSATSITLSWTQPASGARPVYFQVYEGTTVVARDTTTTATVRNLVFRSTHTYTVTAVDRFGRESAPSAAISRTAIEGGAHACGITAPGGLTTTEVTGSAIGLSWSNAQPSYDTPGTLVVLLDGAPVERTVLDSARISGLAPASTHTVQVARQDCSGALHPSPALTVTTAAGPADRPAAPTGLTAGPTTNSSVALSWIGSAARYAVYDGATRVALVSGTATVVTRLWRHTVHEFTVSALDAAGNESAQTAPAWADTLDCDTVVPAPRNVTATAASPSTVTLSWMSITDASGFTVFRDGVAVATVAGPSAVVTGLPPAGASRYTITAQAWSCGSSAPGGPATATTPPGPTARPAAPTGLRLVRDVADYDNTGTVTLAWDQPASADPVAGYRIYEGSTVLATAAATTVSVTLPSGPTHQVVVAAVDAAGDESPLTAPLGFVVQYIPVP
jgi:hypothetical protein